MSNLEVYKFRDWWILTYFIFGHGESSPNNIWSMVNLERTCVLLFYYFLCLKVNLDLEKTNQLGESSPNFIFAVVNLDPIILEKRWIDGESWPNDFCWKGELRWRLKVGRFKMPFDGCIKQWLLAADFCLSVRKLQHYFRLFNAWFGCPPWKWTTKMLNADYR